MKRASFRKRTGVYVNVEDARWKDFLDLCDKERKTASLKINEMVLREIQKNALGSEGSSGPMLDPLNLHKDRVNEPNKSIGLGSLDHWLTRDNALYEIQRPDTDPRVIENIGKNMIIAVIWKKTGVYRRDLKIT